MNFRKHKKRSERNLVDIVPFVDTLLYLIIYFTLSLNFVAQPAIKLKLPQAASPETVRESKELRVMIAPGGSREGYTYGSFSVEGRNIEFSGIEELLKQKAAEGKEAVLIIQADEKVSQGEVVRVMDAAKTAGIDRIAIATRPKDK